MAESHISADATQIYWSTLAWTEDEPTESSWRVAKDGGKEQRLAYHVGRVEPPEGGKTNAPPAGNASRPDGALEDADNVYYVGDETGVRSIVRRPLNGGTPTVLATDPRGSIVEVDATNVYWFSFPSQDSVPVRSMPGGPTIVTSWFLVKSVPKGGGEATTLAAWPGCMRYQAADGANLYFLTGACGESVPEDEFGKGAIVRVPLRGGAATTVASMLHGEGTPQSLVVDETSVYWTDCWGRVMKATPK